MAVYKRTYKPYSGPLTGTQRRWEVITRYSLAKAFSTKMSVVAFVVALVPPLIGAILIYIANNEAVRLALRAGNAPGLGINNQFFLWFMEVQAWVAFFLTALMGPATIAPDLSNNALPLFLSRPVSRVEYILGKVVVLAGVLSAVTWIPLSLLFLLQWQLSATAWFGSNWYVLTGIFLGSWLWIIVLSLVALAVSAWVRWRIVAIAATMAILLVPAGFGGVITGVLRTNWGFLFNIPYLMTLIWTDLLRVPLPLQAVPVPVAWATMIGAAALALILLTRRIEARQVVRG
jgi:ABC-2 type transport system permease protein